jgi:hypothetical protein
MAWDGSWIGSDGMRWTGGRGWRKERERGGRGGEGREEGREGEGEAYLSQHQ